MKKVYTATLIGLGITGGSVGTAIFFYLIMAGAISDYTYSGDTICAGTIEDPCYAYINFTAKEDIFIYPIDYDPWGRNTSFAFDPNLKSWYLQRSWGTGWRTIPLNQSCTGTWCGLSDSKDERKFSVAFREGKTYQIRVVAFKNNPTDVIKWSAFDEIDPTWLGVETEKAKGGIIDLNIADMEWTITKTGAESNLDISYERINSTATRFIMSNVAKYEQELTKEAKDIKDVPISKLKSADKFSVQSKIDMSKDSSFIVNYELGENISFKLGWESVIIDGELVSGGLIAPNAKHICRTPDNIIHVAYAGASSDLFYANSSDDGATWTVTEAVNSISVEHAGIVCLSNNDVVLYYSDGSDIDAINRTNGVFGSVYTVEDDVATTLIFPSCEVDSNDIFYCVFMTSTGDVYMVNSTLFDTTISINTPTNDEYGICTIDINVNDDRYVLCSDDDVDDVIMWDIDNIGIGWENKLTVYEGSVINVGSGATLDGYIFDGVYYIALIDSLDAYFCNVSLSDLSNPSCQLLDSASSCYPNIAVNYNTIEIIKQTCNVASSTFHRINSSDGGLSWSNTQLSTLSDYVSMAGSNFPEVNRVTDLIEYVYEGGVSLTYANYTIPYTIPGDFTPPQIGVVSPESRNYTTTPAMVFYLSGSEAFDSCYGTINNWESNFTMSLSFPSIAQYYNNSMLNGEYTFKPWCNDTSGNINDTVSVQFNMSYIDTACTYDGIGNWTINCINNCTINTAYQIEGDLIINGTSGVFVINETLSFSGQDPYIYISNDVGSCDVLIDTNGEIRRTT